MQARSRHPRREHGARLTLWRARDSTAPARLLQRALGTPMGTRAPSLTHTLAGQHLPALDGLRAIAVFTVIVYHFGISAVPGDLGVSAFFVLSGFLITWLLMKEYRATGAIGVRQFYARRVLRIFPAYYAFLAVSFALDYARAHPWPPSVRWAALLYVVNYHTALRGPPSSSIAHAWSLGIEEQFYLVWPLLLGTLLARGAKRAAQVVAVLIAAVVAWRCALLVGRHADYAYLYNAFDTRFDNLAVGCLLAVCVGAPAFQGIAERLARSAVAPLVTLALLVTSRTAFGPAYHYTLGFTVDAVLVAVLIVQLLQLQGAGLWSWLESAPARFLGTISYPLYLWHAWGLTVGHHVRVAGAVGEFGAGVLASILAAAGSYYAIERPFLALKRRFERRPEPPPPPARTPRPAVSRGLVPQ